MASAVPKFAQDLLAQLRPKKKPGDKERLQDEDSPGEEAASKRRRNILIGVGVGVVVLIVVIVGAAVGASASNGSSSTAGGNDKATGGTGGENPNAPSGGGGGDQKKDVPCSEPSKISAADKQASLDTHNKFRSMVAEAGAANIRRLVWNDDLAARAQDWLNLCVWGHTLQTTCDESEGVGQNLFSQLNNHDVNVTNAIRVWYKEKDSFTYEDVSCLPGKLCGHYLQVSWAETREVGCAVGECATVHELATDEIQGVRNMLVCDYYPTGNYIGAKPYIEGAACSLCASVVPPDGGWMCVDNLCEPCTPDEHGADCVCDPKVCQNSGTFEAGLCSCRCAPHFWGANCELKCECVNDPVYDPACDGYKGDGYCEDKSYVDFMKQKCPVTCDMCDRPATCFDDE